MEQANKFVLNWDGTDACLNCFEITVIMFFKSAWTYSCYCMFAICVMNMWFPIRFNDLIDDIVICDFRLGQ